MIDPTLGEFLGSLDDAVKNGSPNDRCVLCGSTSRLLHPVGRAWACSQCHKPSDGADD